MKINETLDRLFGSFDSTSSGNSPAPKRLRDTDKTQKPNVESTTMNQQDKKWLKEVLGELAGGIIANVNEVRTATQQNAERIVAVDAAVATGFADFRQEMDEVKTKVNLLEQKNSTLQENNRLLQAQLKEVMKEPSVADAQSSGGSGGGPPNTVPFNQRTTFVLGNLGRGLSQPECEEKARQVFREIGITMPPNLYAPFAFGSQVVCEFETHEQGLALKAAVARITSIQEGCSQGMWADVKKSKIERAPSKIVRAVAAAFQAWNDANPGNHPTITRCLMSKRVYADRQIVAQTLKGRLLWTERGEELYPQNLRNNCLSIAANLAS